MHSCKDTENDSVARKNIYYVFNENDYKMDLRYDSHLQVNVCEFIHKTLVRRIYSQNVDNSFSLNGTVWAGYSYFAFLL